MNWQEYGIIIVIGVYIIAVAVLAPYLARKGKHRSTRIQANYHHMLEQLKTSLLVCIGILVLNALIFLPVTFLNNSRQTFTTLGIVELVSAIILLLLYRYLSRLIADFERSDK